ncbi:MAG TPA: SgcJ/EcaC family oxidoreductase [Alphaproteobacteria bacterium]|nr:SgcJ/EcaC family oxidoreductase [Alphaproteobacteria bacterium]
MAKVANAGSARAGQNLKEIRQCLDRWIAAVGNGSSIPVTALYAPDAVLLPTFDGKVLATPATRRFYLTAFKARKGLKAKVDECHIRMLGEDAAMANGLYTFRYKDADGEITTVRARFTFVYARQPSGEWLIVAHHSSHAPAANLNVKSRKR